MGRSEPGPPSRGGGEAAERIAYHIRSTHGPQVISGGGVGAAGLFQLDFPRGILRRNYRDPVLVASTNGGGPKLEIAVEMGMADTAGFDVVAACVNDLVVQGADPLFFLDHIAAAAMEPAVVAEIVGGIARGCREAGCAILGGETAETPELRPRHGYLAGFAVGVVERSRMVQAHGISRGDRILGLLSAGLDSSGYSLLRELFSPADLSLEAPGPGGTLAKTLLRPARIYVRAIQMALRAYRTKKVVHAMAHISGSGLSEHLSRMLPRRADAVIHRDRWEAPPIFHAIQERGGLTDREMFRAFNMGIGMVLVVSPYYADAILERLEAAGSPACPLGEVVRGSGKVILPRR